MDEFANKRLVQIESSNLIDSLHKWRLNLNNNTHTSLASHSCENSFDLNHECEAKNVQSIVIQIYINQINARALIGQSAMFIVSVNSWKNLASSELLYRSNRPQVSMAYRLINHLGCW